MKAIASWWCSAPLDALPRLGLPCNVDDLFYTSLLRRQKDNSMPELPEVEYVARQLRHTLIGRTITDVRVNWARTIAHPGVETFCAELPGAEALRVDRRAKFLLIYLSDEQALVIHRRMTGNLLIFPPVNEGEVWEVVPDAHARAVFLLDDGRRIVFTDPRKFGRIALYTLAELPNALSNLGLEPLSEAFTPEALARLLTGRARQIKPFLLDQSQIAGIGNIYADESLFRAGIHPLRRADSVTPEEVARLHAAIQAVLELGIEHGGTSFSRHQDIWGQAGWNREHLQVYDRAGDPCLRCGTQIARIVVAQRSAHFCPTCQPGAIVEATTTQPIEAAKR